jgi:hypothetical protein
MTATCTARRNLPLVVEARPLTDRRARRTDSRHRTNSSGACNLSGKDLTMLRSAAELFPGSSVLASAPSVRLRNERAALAATDPELREQVRHNDTAEREYALQFAEPVRAAAGDRHYRRDRSARVDRPQSVAAQPGATEADMPLRRAWPAATAAGGEAGAAAQQAPARRRGARAQPAIVATGGGRRAQRSLRRTAGAAAANRRRSRDHGGGRRGDGAGDHGERAGGHAIAGAGAATLGVGAVAANARGPARAAASGAAEGVTAASATGFGTCVAAASRCFKSSLIRARS